MSTLTFARQEHDAALDSYRRAADAGDAAAARVAWDHCDATRKALDDAIVAEISVSARDNARPMNLGRGASVPPEMRDFLTPGSHVDELWVRPSREQSIIPARELRTSWLTTDTATIGSAYYFTDDLYRNLVMMALETSGVLEAGPTVVTTDHVRNVQVPYLTADATATAGTEGSAATDANVTGAGVDLEAFRFDGKFTVSAEMLMSSELPLEQLLTTFASRSLSNKVAQQLAIGAGSGSDEADGLFTSGVVTIGETGYSETGLTLDELITGYKALGKGYRKAAKFVVSDVLHTAMIQAKDDDGDYCLKTLEGGGEQFMGKPLFVEPQADQTSMSTGEVHCVIGDFSGYFVRFGPFFFRRSDADPLNPVFTYATWLSAKLVDASALVSVVTA